MTVDIESWVIAIAFNMRAQPIDDGMVLVAAPFLDATRLQEIEACVLVDRMA